jgi:hypothetical protein
VSRNAIFLRHIATLEVADTVVHWADEKGDWHGKTPSSIEAGKRGGDSEDWQR